MRSGRRRWVGQRPTIDLPGLLRRCRASDDSAWEECYACVRRVTAGVLSGFQNLSPLERELAADNARANIISAMLEARIQGTTNGEILRFFQTVVTNCARDVWRERHPTDPLPPGLRDRSPSPLEAARSRMQLECVRKVMESWSEDNRFLLVMKLNRVSTVDIKTDLERRFHKFISPEAVDVRFHRLRQEPRRQCEGTA